MVGTTFHPAMIIFGSLPTMAGQPVVWLSLWSFSHLRHGWLDEVAPRAGPCLRHLLSSANCQAWVHPPSFWRMPSRWSTRPTCRWALSHAGTYRCRAIATLLDRHHRTPRISCMGFRSFLLHGRHALLYNAQTQSPSWFTKGF